MIDESFKKLREVQDWLEKSFADRVSNIPLVGNGSWSATLNRKKMGKGVDLSFLDPDSQIDENGNVLALEGTDAADQVRNSNHFIVAVDI